MRLSHCCLYGCILNTLYLPTNSDFVPLVNLISILFQIRDDYMNLASTEYGDNKGFCEDLTEGKFSFPVVHAIRASKTDRQILSRVSPVTSVPSIC